MKKEVSKPVLLEPNESRHYDISSHSSEEDKKYYRGLLTWFICMVGLGFGAAIGDLVYGAIRHSGMCEYLYNINH